MTSQTSMWDLGEVRSNAKGGKFLSLEPLFWQSEASLEIPWEPRAFRNRRAREALLGAGRERSGRAAGGRVRARLRREASCCPL